MFPLSDLCAALPVCYPVRQVHQSSGTWIISTQTGRGVSDMKTVYPLIMFIVLALLQGCSPDVGSKEWCMSMKDKPQGEWTSNDASSFMKFCNVTDLLGE